LPGTLCSSTARRPTPRGRAALGPRTRPLPPPLPTACFNLASGATPSGYVRPTYAGLKRARARRRTHSTLPNQAGNMDVVASPQVVANGAQRAACWEVVIHARLLVRAWLQSRHCKSMGKAVKGSFKTAKAHICPGSKARGGLDGLAARCCSIPAQPSIPSHGTRLARKAAAPGATLREERTTASPRTQRRSRACRPAAPSRGALACSACGRVCRSSAHPQGQQRRLPTAHAPGPLAAEPRAARPASSASGCASEASGHTRHRLARLAGGRAQHTAREAGG
jgi:hypothetical protein